MKLPINQLVGLKDTWEGLIKMTIPLFVHWNIFQSILHQHLLIYFPIENLMSRPCFGSKEYSYPSSLPKGISATSSL